MKTVFIDIETDRLDPLTANPIQIAAIAVDSVTLKTVDELEIKVAFDADAADSDALERNCYTPEAWVDALSVQESQDQLNAFFREHSTWRRTSKSSGRTYTTCELAGHNIASYDAPIIERWYKDSDSWCSAATFTTGPVDTMHMARCLAWLKGEDWGGYSLGALCEKFGISLENEHDALEDVRATVKLAECLREVM